jgi:hypothetical protein
VWGEKAQHDEEAEWIRRKEERKVSNIVWVPIRSMETILSKTHNFKYPGSDQIQNY